MRIENKKQKRTIITESIAIFMPWIAFAVIVISAISFFGLGRFLGLTLGDDINFFLSSVIAMFALVEGFSTYLEVRIEKDRNRLQEIKDELEKVYGPLYGIFNKKREYIQEKEFVFINDDEKKKVDNIIVSFPFLAEPVLLDVWRKYIERREPYKTVPTTIFAIPMFFVTHITIPYDELTDEYHKRIGKELRTESSFEQRLRRYPPNEKELNTP